jgi:hypothetical protein
MKMSKLSKEECEILEAFEKGSLKRAKKAANTQKPYSKKMRVSTSGFRQRICAGCRSVPWQKAFLTKP